MGAGDGVKILTVRLLKTTCEVAEDVTRVGPACDGEWRSRDD